MNLDIDLSPHLTLLGLVDSRTSAALLRLRIDKLKDSKVVPARRAALVAETLLNELVSRLNQGLTEVGHDAQAREEMRRLTPDYYDHVQEQVQEDLAVAPALGLTAEDTAAINVATAVQTLYLAQYLVDHCRWCCDRADELSQQI